MAKPRFFISSTFYDLKQVRQDLDKYITESGFEAVRNETGVIAYGTGESPAKSAIREAGNCDVVVVIVGARRGSQAPDAETSIVEEEVKSAHESGRLIFIFVDQAVFGEYETWLKNKENKEFVPAHVDDVRQYEFLNRINTITTTNPVFPFSSGFEIVELLRNQIAGLFQQLLDNRRTHQSVSILNKLSTAVNSIEDLIVTYAKSKEEIEQDTNLTVAAFHPACIRMRKLLDSSALVIFRNWKELDEYLRLAGYSHTQSPFADDLEQEWNNDILEYTKYDGSLKFTLNIKGSIFNSDGELKPIKEVDFEEDMIELRSKRIKIMFKKNDEAHDPFSEDIHDPFAED